MFCLLFLSYSCFSIISLSPLLSLYLFVSLCFPLSPSAYRFLPVLMVFCVYLVCVLNRDFGPMLTAERKKLRVSVNYQVAIDNQSRLEEGKRGERENDELVTGASDTSHEDNDDPLFEG